MCQIEKRPVRPRDGDQVRLALPGVERERIGGCAWCLTLPGGSRLDAAKAIGDPIVAPLTIVNHEEVRTAIPSMKSDSDVLA